MKPPLSPEEARHVAEHLQDLAHDLRTPLNAIIGYAELLLEDAQSDNRAQVASDLQRIIRAGRDMQKVIADSLVTTSQSATEKDS